MAKTSKRIYSSVGPSARIRSTVRLLVVEDNEFDYQLLINRLRKSTFAYEHRMTEDLDEFKELLESYQPDVVLSDFNLGGFSGLDVIQAAKEFNSLLPVIIVTGRVNEETSVKCLKEGAWNYILKDNLMMVPIAIRNALDYVEEQQEKLNAWEALRLQNETLRSLNEELTLAKVQAEESSRLKGMFIKNISHEIRTPLNGIMGFVSLLSSESDIPEEFKMYLDLIQTSSVDLLNAMTNILNLSLIESNQVEVHRKLVDWEQVMDNLKSEYGSIARQKNVGLVFTSGNVKEKTFMADSQLIFEVLKQLVDNGVKFTEEGCVEIASELIGEVLVVRIIDTGIGIARENFSSIFDSFLKSDEVESIYRGNGLGLTIARGFVERLGGHIMIDSELGQGSVFTVHVPVNLQ
jgi:signal transduction histidine kinase